MLVKMANKSGGNVRGEIRYGNDENEVRYRGCRIQTEVGEEVI
jgi:hypothetical protein